MAGKLIIRDKQDHITRRSIIPRIEVSKNGGRYWHLTIFNRTGQAGILAVEAVDGETVINKLIPPNRQQVTEE